jgi:hypothetical protein
MLAKTTSFQKEQNLSIVQIKSSNQNSFDFITGLAAIKENLIEVKEVSESAAVNTLNVFNLSKQFVFFMDGDILSGAKQNRVLNTSILLAPNSKTHIPVCCVERGRWSHISEKFQSTDYIAPSFLRAKKAGRINDSLASGMSFMANQGEVWDDVKSYSIRAGVKSKSDNLSDVFEGKRGDFDQFISGFKLNTNANGMAVFVKGNLLSIDIFNRTNIFAEYFPRILRGCAMEVFGLKGSAEITEAEASYKAIDFIEKFERQEFRDYPGAGVGIERRYRSEELTGFELVYNSNLIHLTALNLSKEK